jgi:hypothetical protein
MKRTGEVMDWLRTRPKDFCRPGQVKELGDTGVRAFVLGPPTDLKKLRKDLPTKRGRETYEHGDEDHPALSPSDRALVSARGVGADGDADPYHPFGGRHAVPPGQARLHPFFQRHYGFLDDDPDAWRRVDVWAAGASDLALKLDSDTNNTSLALALELPNGKVLLFPGDAQVGNWESWHRFAGDDGREVELSWPAGDGVCTARDLLGRTILYKVGHHGSHNATLRAQGLELMTDPDLVAMIPVDEEDALGQRPPQDGWKMPFEPLYRALERRTRKRILRADRDFTPDETAWRGWEERVAVPAGETLTGTERPLYVDYTIPIS